jgi:arylsulfatase A-like enzyme
LTLGCALLLVVATAGCGSGSGGEAGTVRLVDVFDEARIEGAAARVAASKPIEWTFEQAGAAADAGIGSHDVAGLLLRDGRLVGRTTGTTPIVLIEREAPVDEDDLLWSLELVLRVDAGGELAINFDSSDEPNLKRAADNPFPWALTAPLVPGDDVQRYTLRPARPVSLSRVRHILIRPGTTAGTSFEIDSLRVITRREHLGAIESGVGWHGMDGVFREAIVTRAPESVTFDVTLPARPRLDLALATIEDGAATFRVEVRAEALEPVVIERTVTRPHRWNPMWLPLDGLSGRDVTLTLDTSSEQEGFLGFWGGVTLRSRVEEAARAPASGKRPQGVIVLLADTLRTDHVSGFGYERDTAPVLAGLAAQGVTALDCVSQATWTKVSVPAIFTSLYPTTHTVSEFTDRLPATATTMAEVFREAGYATLALTSISFTGQFTNLHQGYEEFHESSSLKESSDAKTAREHIDRLLPWLEQHHDVPFFVLLHVADPHSPYRAYAPFDTSWGEPGDSERLDRHIEQVRPHIENPVMQRFGMPTRTELERAGIEPAEFVRYEKNAYDGSIRAMDVEVGRLLERLRELDLYDRTLLTLVSDHGTEFLDHDAHFHGHSVYGELNRVPLMFWRPGLVPSDIVLEPTVQTIDLMPTVLELAGLPLPSAAQGESLVPLMQAAARGESMRWRRPAITEKAIMTMRELPGRSFASVSLISDGFKLIHNDPAPPDGSAYELYDHRADPLNTRDLAAEQPERVAALAKLLEQWRESARAARLDDSALRESLDDAALERLRSLGYLR